MQLYLVRHAIAVPKDAPGVLDDPSRPLTPLGIRKMRQNVAGLVRMKVTFDEIWTSPLTRARQTAELLVVGLRSPTPVRVVATLDPDSSFEGVLRQLADQSHLNSVALVGHEPWLSRFTTFLVAGTHGETIAYKKGGIACLDVEDWTPPVRGCLQWLLTPKLMARMR